jgi:hypothetical protein
MAAQQGRGKGNQRCLT